MCATAANLVECVLPEVDLRQWVLTFPFAWRSRLGQDGALLGTLTRLFVQTVQSFYAQRAAASGVSGAKTGAVTVVQRTSSDLRLNPHLHVVLATSVPPPRFHTVKYAGVLASASPWRTRIAPPREPPPPAAETQDAELSVKHASRYRAWAELLKRTFDIDVLDCPKCHGRMKLLAMITDGKSVARYLSKLGEPTDVPARSASRGPPYWKSRVLRLKSMAGQQ
jgi:hypothetical protein